MVVWTTKLTKKKVVVLILIAALVLCAVIRAMPGRNLPGTMENQIPVGTKEGCYDFLCGFGWQVESEPLEIAEVVIPAEFDAVYQTYNEIQLAQGYDLTDDAGETALMYTYRILNHPSGEAEVRANVLTLEEKIIGGDVCSLKIDGFMHGFEMPNMGETEQNPSMDRVQTFETVTDVQPEEIPAGIFAEE